jgi:hypothetical protein
MDIKSSNAHDSLVLKPLASGTLATFLMSEAS